MAPRGQPNLMTEPLKRIERTRRADPDNVPRPIAGEADLVAIDTTWGKVQPIEPFPGVRTIGELELAELVGAGAALIDTRVPDSRSGMTIPGAVNVPHEEIVARRDELHEHKINILFCNGPQCPQTPDAIGKLIAANYPTGSLAYYRGGLHDWVSLGYPAESI